LKGFFGLHEPYISQIGQTYEGSNEVIAGALAVKHHGNNAGMLATITGIPNCELFDCKYISCVGLAINADQKSCSTQTYPCYDCSFLVTSSIQTLFLFGESSLLAVWFDFCS
jgi:hypothetical protein